MYYWKFTCLLFLYWQPLEGTLAPLAGWCKLYSKATYICFFFFLLLLLSGANYTSEITILFPVVYWFYGRGLAMRYSSIFFFFLFCVHAQYMMRNVFSVNVTTFWCWRSAGKNKVDSNLIGCLICLVMWDFKNTNYRIWQMSVWTMRVFIQAIMR